MPEVWWSDSWLVLKVEWAPTRRWLVIPPDRRGHAHFDTQAEAFEYAFWACSDRREMFGVKVDDCLVAWGTKADMEQLSEELITEGLTDARFVYQRGTEWVEP